MKESSVSAFVRAIAVDRVRGSRTRPSERARSWRSRLVRSRDGFATRLALRLRALRSESMAPRSVRWPMRRATTSSTTSRPACMSWSATFVGYKPVGVSGLRVSGRPDDHPGLHARADPHCRSRKSPLTAAQNALVPRDQVTTKQTLQGDFVEKLPVDQDPGRPGAAAGRRASNGARTITIRGGRTDEAVTYIDGVPVSAGQPRYAVSGRHGTRVTEPQVGPTASKTPR